MKLWEFLLYIVDTSASITPYLHQNPQLAVEQ